MWVFGKENQFGDDLQIKITGNRKLGIMSLGLITPWGGVSYQSERVHKFSHLKRYTFRKFDSLLQHIGHEFSQPDSEPCARTGKQPLA